MASVGKIAPRDKTAQLAVRFKDEDSGEVEYLNVVFYKNRMSMAPMEALLDEEVAKDLSDDQLEAARVSSNICNSIQSWDLEGPVYDYRGKEVVGEGEIVPLDPLIVMRIPTALNIEIIRQLVEAVSPNESKSRNERRRSR